MVLLTSGQVSVAITSVVVFLFTTALFLSGYILQQQTVRDLRAAIKPHVQPPQVKIHLPAKFAKPSPKEHGVEIQVTKSTQDSHVAPVIIDELNPEAMESRQNKLNPTNPEPLVLPPMEDLLIKAAPHKNKKEEEKPVSRAERRRRLKEDLTAGSEEEGFRGYRRRMW